MKNGKASWETADLNDCNYSSNITRDLDKLSMVPVRRSNVMRVVKKLQNITARHAGYQSIDVTLTSEILEKIVDVKHKLTEVGTW